MNELNCTLFKVKKKSIQIKKDANLKTLVLDLGFFIKMEYWNYAKGSKVYKNKFKCVAYDFSFTMLPFPVRFSDFI